MINSDLMRWLLDLEQIPAQAEELRLVWERTWPLWFWAILLVAGAAFVAWSYSRLTGPRVGRGVLAFGRFLVLALILALVSGPMIEMPRKSIEEDWVLALVDRSASMTIADATDTQGNRQSRDNQLRTMLGAHRDTWTTLDEERHVVWMGFHYGAFNLDDTPLTDDDAATLDESAIPVHLDIPRGQRTSVSSALEQALQRSAARPVSGIVLFSDGRTIEPPTRAVIRRLQADAVPVFVVPLGAAESIGDLAIRRVEAPRRAFVRDKVPVTIEIDRLGSGQQQLTGSVRLLDTQTGEELDRVELDPSEDGSDQITLTAVPQLAGEATWQVVVDTETPDLIPANNLKPFVIELVDRPLRVLFVEGYPRWEYRYLKNLLIREKSIESSVILLSADRDFAQEGNVPITRLPRSPEEFAEFDVIVLGDVPGSFFSPDQLEMLREQVADRGAGLLWIGGERYTPNSYIGNVMADLLPMRGPLSLSKIDRPVNMQPTDLAVRLGVLQLASSSGIGWPRELSDPTYGWSRLYYAQQIEPGRLKPTAEMLAETVDEFSGTRLPLVVAMRYGAGQTIYVATDEVWRWRYGRGELYPDQFWVQMLRYLGRQSLATAGDRAVLEVNPRRVIVNQPVRIELRLIDAQLAEEQRLSVSAVLEDARGLALAEIDFHLQQHKCDISGIFTRCIKVEM